MTATKAKIRRFSGFGVVTRQGRFLWHYARPEEADTRKPMNGTTRKLTGTRTAIGLSV